MKRPQFHTYCIFLVHIQNKRPTSKNFNDAVIILNNGLIKIKMYSHISKKNIAIYCRKVIATPSICDGSTHPFFTGGWVVVFNASLATIYNNIRKQYILIFMRPLIRIVTPSLKFFDIGHLFCMSTGCGNIYEIVTFSQKNVRKFSTF